MATQRHREAAGAASFHASPAAVVVQGLTAGLGATLLLSALARLLPGMHPAASREESGRDAKPQMPEDPTDRQAVLEWQAVSQSPAAYTAAAIPTPPLPSRGGKAGGPPEITPAGALSEPTAPGPEGLAEQFAHKVASGVFGRDITAQSRVAGMGVHVVYGSFWGALYGIAQASRPQPISRIGALYGLGVWAVGPAWLVPSMRLMGYPWQEPPLRTAMLVAGHVVYGLAVASAFERLRQER